MFGTERKISDRVRKTRETARNTFAIASEKTRADRMRKPFFQVMCFFMDSIIPEILSRSSLFFALFADGVAGIFGKVAMTHATVAAIAGVAWLVHVYIVPERLAVSTKNQEIA